MTTQQDEVHGRETRRTIAISGSSGLIGTALAAALVRDGHVVKHLVRREARDSNEIMWHPERAEIDAERLEGVDVVVNLSGEPLDQRWNGEVKRRIRESRVKATTLLATTIAAMQRKPTAMLSGSAIGIYGNRGDELLDERSATGSGFLAEVCREWEASTRVAEDAGVRVVHLRTGLVLARYGGLLAKLLTPFRLGVGGKLGSGRQWMSWIALEDWVGALRFALSHDEIVGPVNLAAPNPTTNADFTHAVANELHRPAAIAVPAFALKIAFGEMANEAALASQRATPAALLRAGYTFTLPALEQALASILSR